jgi:hypothetical protein
MSAIPGRRRAPHQSWVLWWVADPADRRIEIDVYSPPERTSDGWRYVDLELDSVRHEQTSWTEIEGVQPGERSLTVPGRGRVARPERSAGTSPHPR